MTQYFTNNTMMGEYIRQVSDAFWRPDFWLPFGLRWEDLQSTGDLQLAEFSDVWTYPLLFSIIFVLIQHLILEPLVLSPLARAAGISNWRPPPPPPNTALEVVFLQHGSIAPEAVLMKASRTSNLSVRQAERWLRARHKATRINKHDMFVNNGVTAIMHSAFCISGWILMYNKPWVWNITLCWQNYPYHNLDVEVWWYYMVILASFWAVTISEIVQPRRKVDGRYKIIFHHLCTVMLLTFSWICHFTRIGTVVLLVHECADIPLLIAKMFKYSGWEKVSNVLFAVFLVLWLVTRCGIYPFWVMPRVFFESTTYMMMPSAYLFFTLLTALLIVNQLWTVLILRVLFKALLQKTPLKEERSTTESEDKDEDTKKDD
ncbi:ceramide synthase 6-like [Homarus americanus]|uniref:Ceramide synthase 6-like 3 n=1 Tax=Homarus americanus TaxID=6706 RepID=A0A8J5JIX8_HOMAM|nr:ceramide synthase 6-like [Homarus americanus]KAG7159302.1 Ceramide synthase 6-like 3 [Homarus americanus]